MQIRPHHLTLSGACCLGALLFLAACGPAATPQAVTQAPAAAPTDMPTEPPPVSTPEPTSGSSRPAAATGPQVTLQNFSFTPQALTVKSGTTVTWVNHDDTPHTVTSADHLFGTTALDTDDRFTYRFDTPGTYRYFCTIHPKMTATVIVQ